MASLGGIDAYMEQWLKTATKGNVRFTMAFLTNRMHLHCDVCNIGLTYEKPIDANTIDYAVQEYVKLHAHTGGHGDEWECEMCGDMITGPATGPDGHYVKCQAMVIAQNQDWCSHKKADGTTACIKHQMLNGDIWIRCMRCGAQMKPVTADFKSLPMESGGQTAYYDASKIQELKAGTPMIDEKPQNAAKIYDAMDKYDKSQMTDQQLAKKIAELQLWAKSQLKQVPSVIEHTPPPPRSAPVSDVFEDKGRKFR